MFPVCRTNQDFEHRKLSLAALETPRNFPRECEPIRGKSPIYGVIAHVNETTGASES